MTETVHNSRQANNGSLNIEPENDAAQVQMQQSHERLHPGKAIVATASHITNITTYNQEPKGDRLRLPPRIITTHSPATPQKAEQRDPPSTTSSRSYMQDMIATHKTKRMSGLLGNTAISQSLKEIETGNAVHEMRLNMREELLMRLHKTPLGGPSASKQSPQVQAAFAKRLEEVLFKTSKSVEAYSDVSTLDKRLQGLMSAMQKRKARSTGSSIAASNTPGTVQGAEQRRPSLSKTPIAFRKRALLLKHLGQAKMVRVFKVVAEIKLIQLGREVTEGKPYEPIRKCGPTGCSFSVPCQGDQKAPKVVRDLFFNTAIVKVLERCSPEKMETLPWDQLLAQGEARVAAYHVWFRERRAEEMMDHNKSS